MTNAIEQTKREMYGALASLKGRVDINYSVKDILRGVDEFEGLLEDHLEELRKAMVTINESTVRCAQASAGSFVDLEARVATLTEERDELRNKLQAQQMASATSAEIISGLRKDLFEARSFDTGAMQRVQAGNTSSDRTDAYTLGFNGAGKCSNPFPTNTIERLHWNDGANDAKAETEDRRRPAIDAFRSHMG